jgi:hypothetical protein
VLPAQLTQSLVSVTAAMMAIVAERVPKKVLEVPRPARVPTLTMIRPLPLPNARSGRLRFPPLPSRPVRVSSRAGRSVRMPSTHAGPCLAAWPGCGGMSYPPGRMAGTRQALDDGEAGDGLVRDMAEVLTLFCARLCGCRSAGDRPSESSWLRLAGYRPWAVLAGTADGGGEDDR